MELNVIDIAVFATFAITVVTVGVLMSRHEKDSESYFLAGRGLSWWLIGFSLIAANISAEQFVGMSGQAAMSNVGLAIASYEWIAAVTLVVVAFFFLPKFLRSGIFTIPQYLEYRFTHGARTLMSLYMVVIYVGVTIATVTYLGAKAMEPWFAGKTLFGRPVDMTMLSWIIGVTAAVYVAAGGLKACAWADLIQGAALIAGGAVIMVLAFMALDSPERFGLDSTSVGLGGKLAGAGVMEKFRTLNAGKLHMVLDRDNPVIPYTALMLGIWIPNFYYWGLNQYIMQRALGAKSLAHGQKGVVFAAGLKLIIPFIVCVPGIIAFNLYSGKMRDNARESVDWNAPRLARFEQLKGSPAKAKAVFPYDNDFAELYPDKAREILVFNAAMAGVQISGGTDNKAAQQQIAESLSRRSPALAGKLEDLQKNAPDMTPQRLEATRLASLNAEAVARATGENQSIWRQWLNWLGGQSPGIEKQQGLIGYDYDGAFPLLIRHLTPPGLRGFVLAALLGAVVSSLASMLNAASTIFTMDIYREYISRNASQRALVIVGRICVLAAVLLACLIAPRLADPRFKGAFSYIQEFQGYVSPGVLTIFLFGLFITRAPRTCGLVGLLLGPVIYGALHLFFSGMPFLNRMAITVGILAAVLAVMTIVAPNKRAITLPEQEKFDLASSGAAKAFAVVVALATGALYFVFW